MFICYKCGYKDLNGQKKTSCPICGANITIPKSALVVFLSFISYIVFTFSSAFNDKLNVIVVISVIIGVIFAPFAIIDAVKRMSKIQNGFRAIDCPSKIIKAVSRVPDFKSFDYVYGITDDDGVKKIMLEPYKDGLNYYYNKLTETQKIDYTDIVGLELHEETELKMSTAKSLVYGALLGAMSGLGAGMVGFALGGVKCKNRYILEIQFKENGEEKSLYITSNKNKLIALAKDIENKANGKD